MQRQFPEDSDGVRMSIPLAHCVLLVALTGTLAGCARTSTVALDENMIEVAVRVPTICSGADADRLAQRQAAVETIRRGFESYVVVDSVGGDHVEGYVPWTARTNLEGSGTTPIFADAAPLIAHHRVLTVQLFRAEQGDSANAVSARAALGRDWETLVTSGAPAMCFGIGG